MYDDPKKHLAQFIMFSRRSTEKATLFTRTGNKDDGVWLPNSQVSVTPTGNRWQYFVTMPEWLAKKNHLG